MRASLSGEPGQLPSCPASATAGERRGTWGRTSSSSPPARRKQVIRARWRALMTPVQPGNRRLSRKNSRAGRYFRAPQGIASSPGAHARRALQVSPSAGKRFNNSGWCLSSRHISSADDPCSPAAARRRQPADAGGALNQYRGRLSEVNGGVLRCQRMTRGVAGWRGRRRRSAGVGAGTRSVWHGGTEVRSVGASLAVTGRIGEKVLCHGRGVDLGRRGTHSTPISAEPFDLTRGRLYR
jgi:hypothetical protein